MGVKGYFRREFQLSMFGLQEDYATDFYVSCFQKNRSAVPLLCIRLLIMLGCLGILVSSMVLTTELMPIGFWFTFLTHWGLIFITVTSVLAFAVSVRAYIRGPIDATFGLPWYVKLYWVCFNATVPITFFITLFYWVFLTAKDEEYAFNPVLDVFIHLINSVLMLLLVIFSRHPSRWLHFHHAVLLSTVYLLFSIIYYFAGGLGPFGTGYLYPMLDWSNPLLASITTVASAVGIIVLHLLVVGIAKLRDVLTKTCRNSSSSLSITNERYG